MGGGEAGGGNVRDNNVKFVRELLYQGIWGHAPYSYVLL